MSDHYEVYVRSHQQGSPQSVMDDLASITGVTFIPMQQDSTDWFIGPPDARYIEVDFASDLEDYGDIPFSSYPTCITIHGRGDSEFEETTARKIYDGLITVGKYDCFLVHGSGPLLAIHQQN